jgi:hypothetical protein
VLTTYLEEKAMKRIYTSTTFFAVLAMVTTVCNRSYADPLPGEILKFQQLPLNNGLGVIINGVPTGAGGAPFPGHDEPSTAYLNTAGTYSGSFAADDFADNYSTPVVHVTWWGSYLPNANGTVTTGAQQFLISFESDVPAGPASSFSQPGTPLLAETVHAGALAPASGTFTETLVASSNAADPLYQYNAELALPFKEQKDTVYWLKIVALDNQATQGTFAWGWHNRDWGIKDPLASPVPAPGENIEGTVGNSPVWHFQDDAVNGQVVAAVNSTGTARIVSEVSAGPLNYTFTPGAVPIDGPPGIQNYSEDLAFQLYTPSVPEPSTIALLGLGAVSLGVKLWRRRQLQDG